VQHLVAAIWALSGPLLTPLASRAQEFGSFLKVQTQTELVVDRSPPSELLKITFNVR
jgi:hypothetical protein